MRWQKAKKSDKRFSTNEFEASGGGFLRFAPDLRRRRCFVHLIGGDDFILTFDWLVADRVSSRSLLRQSSAAAFLDFGF